MKRAIGRVIVRSIREWLEKKKKPSSKDMGNKKNDNTKAGKKWKAPNGKWYIQKRDKTSSKR